MMIADQLAAAVAEARSGAALDNLGRILWRGFAEGHIDELAADLVSNAIEARRTVLAAARTIKAVSAPVSPSKPRRAPRTPDRQRSIERRRRLAASGAMPPAIASRFTTGEIAVLSVVAREIQRRGRCELHVDAVAALAGVCRRLVQSTLRAAARAGLISVHERRRRGAPSLTNVVQIEDAGWVTWLRLSKGGGQGAENCTPRNNRNRTGYGAWGKPPRHVHHPLRSPSVPDSFCHGEGEDGEHGDQIRARPAQA
jgi:hypothetical protein